MTNEAAERLARMGWTAALTGETARGIAMLEEAVVAAPESRLVLNALGLALAKALRPNEALPYLQRSLAIAPDDVEIACIVGELSLERNDFGTALSALRRCIELDPEARHPSGIRARALIKKGEKRLVALVQR